jgi:hypothetical protein
MATLKTIILPKNFKENGDCNIYIQISHKTKVARIKTGICVLPENFQLGKVVSGKLGDKNATIKNIRLSEKQTAYERLLIDNEQRIENLDVNGIKVFLETGKALVVTDFFKFTEERLAELKEDGKTTTYSLVSNMLRLVREYHKKSSLNFLDIDKRFLEKFATWCEQPRDRKKGDKINSIAVYMRYIRSIFNQAITMYNKDVRNPVILNYPFREYSIITEKTKNRNLHVDMIRAIRDMKPENAREEITQSVIMLQFYLDGINIIDLFYLRPGDLTDGRLQYNRSKTGHYFDVKIEPEAQAIMDKYKGEKYLLKFADNCREERIAKGREHGRFKLLAWQDSVSFGKMLNDNLRIFQERLKLKIKGDLTSYWVRHSFASIASELDISDDIISQALGHKAVDQHAKTTAIYTWKDFKKIDRINRDILDFLNSDFIDGEAWLDYKVKEKAKQLIKENKKSKQG